MPDLPPGLSLASTAINRPSHVGEASRKRKTLASTSPRAFFYAAAKSRVVQGAGMCMRAERRETDSLVRVILERFVFLEQPFVIANTDVQFSQVFSLLEDAERNLRTQATKSGGTLNDHFQNCASQCWKVVNINQDCNLAFDAVSGRWPDFIYVSKFAIQRMGVGVKLVDAFTDLREERAEPEQDGVEAAMDQIVQSEGQVRDSSTADSAGARPEDEAIRRLKQIASTTAGSVSVRYTSGGILSMLKFASNLKPKAEIGQALCDAAEIYFGVDCARRLLTALKDKVNSYRA